LGPWRKAYAEKYISILRIVSADHGNCFAAFGGNITTRADANADINDDRVVDIFDAIILATHYREK
jgi:hypothetical protein